MPIKILHYFSPVGYTILNYKTSNKHRKYAVFGKQFVTRFTDSGYSMCLEIEQNRIGGPCAFLYKKWAQIALKVPALYDKIKMYCV